jgi:hypothetical protein
MQLRAPARDIFDTAKTLISEQGVVAAGGPLIARTAVWLAVLLTFGCARDWPDLPFRSTLEIHPGSLVSADDRCPDDV